MKLRLQSEYGAVALYEIACLIIEDAKANTPVDTTMLQESGYVEMPVRHPKGWALEIGFGGPAGQYAMIQHEDTSLAHTTGGPKFLTNAVNKYKSGFTQILRQFMLEAEGSHRKLVQNSDIKTNPWQPPTFRARGKS